MQFLKGYDLQTLLASDEPKICLYLLSDPETHPLLNSLSCIYVKTQDGEFYSSFTHVDYPHQDYQGLVLRNAFVYDIKQLLHLGLDVQNCFDLKYFDNKEVHNQLSTFYSVRLSQVSNLNSVIPIYSHLDTLQQIGQSLDVALLDKKKDVFDQKYLTAYHNIIPYVFSKIESEGLSVDHDTFLNSFGLERRNLINDDKVLTNYNHYTTTGRPSNAYGGINYAALNKADNSRTSFISRHENGRLVNMDFNGYHLFLVAEHIGMELPDDPHTMLGQQYFKTTELTPKQYKESKVITFRNLYGYQLEDIAKDIPLFRNVDKFQDTLWTDYQRQGKLVTRFGKKIVVENATRNKVFNYFVQSVEAETNIRYLYNLIKQDMVPILYTYDSMLFDVEEAKIDNLINILRDVLKHPFSISIGDNLKNMKFEQF